MYLNCLPNGEDVRFSTVKTCVDEALSESSPLLGALLNEMDVSRRVAAAGSLQVVWECLSGKLLKQQEAGLVQAVEYFRQLLNTIFSDNASIALSESETLLLQQWHDGAARFLSEPVSVESLYSWLRVLDHSLMERFLNHQDIELLCDEICVVAEDGASSWSIDHCRESLDVLESLVESEEAVYSQDIYDVQNALWQSVIENLEQRGDVELVSLVRHYLCQFEQLLKQQTISPADELFELILYWHQEFIDYLEEPDPESVEALREIFLDPAWPVSFDDEEECAELADRDVDVSPSAENLLADEPLFDVQVLKAKTGSAPIDPALLAMVGAELHRLVENVSVESQALFSAWCDQTAALQNISRACDTIGLWGLAFVFDWLRSNLQAFDENVVDAEHASGQLQKIVLLLESYLKQPDLSEYGDDLVAICQMPEWPQPLDQDAAEVLTSALAVSVLQPEQIAEQIQQIEATADDVSLKLPEGVSNELYGVLLKELPHLSQTFSSTIQVMKEPDASIVCVLEAQRVAHTLKGACNTIGIQGIANLTHCLEDIFEVLSGDNVLPAGALGDALLDAADCLEAMSESVISDEDAPEESLVILQSMLDWHYRLKTEGTALHCRACVVEALAPQQSAEPSPVAPQLSPALDNDVDELLLAVGEASSFGDRTSDKIESCLDESHELRDMSWKINELAADMDRLINIQTPAFSRGHNILDFDSLEMEQYSELHSSISRLQELTADVREINARLRGQLLDAKNLLHDQRLLHREQMENIQNMRLVPVHSIVSRCQRIVRQAAKMTGKEVVLTISGEHTLVDSDMLDDLAEPLMHILRNAVDHGLEDRETRLAAGKSESGNIHLRFSKELNFFNVTCEDDGAGLDEDVILRKAVEKGVVEQDQVLSSEQIQRLIFRPGFSTKEERSQVSGRGIGMDVVKNQISLMNGTMDLHSEPKQGLTVSISLLANLYDARVLLVEHKQQVWALAEHGIKQIVSAIDGRIVQDSDSHYHFQVGDDIYPLASFDYLLNLGEQLFTVGPCGAILFQDAYGAEVAVPIDRVIGSNILMIRSFGEYLKGIYGVLGGVLLADGGIAPVIDLYELITDSERRELIDDAEQFVDSRVELEKVKVLVVDDSLSARKLTAQLMSDSGFDVRTAIDGLDAIEKIEQCKPEIMLVDMEMPRMNGIELCRYLKDQPTLCDIPVIMITSRSTDKHRQQARSAGVDRYFVKPFNEDDLMLEIGALLEKENTVAA